MSNTRPEHQILKQILSQCQNRLDSTKSTESTTKRTSAASESSKLGKPDTKSLDFPFEVQKIVHLFKQYRILQFLMNDSVSINSESKSISQNFLRNWNLCLGDMVKCQVGAFRYEGLCLLKETVAVSNMEFLTDSLQYWSSWIVAILKKKGEPDHIRGMAVLTAGALLNRSTFWPETKRDTLKNLLPQISPVLLRALEKGKCEYKKQALMTLISILPQIKFSLRPQIPTIRTLVTKLLATEHFELASSVLSLLPLDDNMWSEIFMEIMGNLEKLVNIAFEESGTQFPASKLIFLLESHFKCLTLLTGSNFNFNVNLPVEKILKFLIKIFNRDGSNIEAFQNTSLTPLDYFEILPLLHQHGYNLLESILNLKTTIFPHVPLIYKILVHGLNCGKQTQCYPLHHIKLRSTIYTLLSNLIQITGTSIENQIKPIVEHILDDLKTNYQKPKSWVTITDPKSSKKQKRKRGEVQQLSLREEDEGAVDNLLGDMSFYEVPFEIQKSALMTLRILLNSAGPELDKEMRLNIDKVILSLGLFLFGQPVTYDFDSCHTKVRDKEYRALVYELIKVSAIVQTHTQASILPYAIKFLNNGLNDPSFQVSGICKEALAVCSVVVHPVAPPIHPKERFLPDNENFLNNLTLPEPQTNFFSSFLPPPQYPSAPVEFLTTPAPVAPSAPSLSVQVTAQNSPVAQTSIEFSSFSIPILQPPIEIQSTNGVEAPIMNTAQPSEITSQIPKKSTLDAFFFPRSEEEIVIISDEDEPEPKKLKISQEESKKLEISQEEPPKVPFIFEDDDAKESESSSEIEGLPEIIELDPDSSSEN